MRGSDIALTRTPDLMASLRAAAQPSPDPLETTRSVLWIALAIRKLSETGELPPALLRQQWAVRLHPRRDGVPPSQDIGSAYELSIARNESASTLQLCGLLIHCAIFAATEGGIYFTSHYEKQRGLYFLEWAIIGRMVDAVCDDDAGSGVIRAA